MSLSRKVAQELCNAQELQIFDESSMHGIKALSNKQIEAKIKIARKYRDKYSDLHTQQMREIKNQNGRGAGLDVAIRTARKVKVFDDCLYRFESTLQKRLEYASRPKKPLGRPPGSANKYKFPEPKKKVSKKVSAKKTRK